MSTIIEEDEAEYLQSARSQALLLPPLSQAEQKRLSKKKKKKKKKGDSRLSGGSFK